MQFTQKTVQCLSPSGLHRMAYLEWGERDNPRVLVCVHGLTRNARDFDDLARAMSGHYRVICPDVVGRGRSGRLRDPAAYAIPQYVADMVTLIARLNVDSVHWVGTSMGGLIGMALAAQECTPVRKLLLNDVGPLISVESLKRIGEYVGADPTWATFDEALAYVMRISAPFGDLSAAQWHHLTESSIAQRPDGRWGFLYDPQIAAPYHASFGEQDIDLWPIYDAVKCPTMVLRGADSDLLTRETWRQMGGRGPHARLAEIPGVGHAPMFMTQGQIDLARDFLLSRMKHIVIDGLRLEYRDFPAAEPGRPELLLLHEGLGCVAMWRHFPEQLAAATGCRVIVWSRAGYGGSQAYAEPRNMRYMHREGEQALPALLAALHVERPVLIGHSDGGSIALIFAGAFPEVPLGIAVMAPHEFVEEDTLAGIREARTAWETTDLPKKLARYHHEQTERVFRDWNDCWLSPPFRDWNIEEYLGKIRCPVLAIQGEDDEYATMRQIDAIAEQVPGTQLLKLAKCGHTPQRDQEVAVLAALVDFVDRLGVAARG